MHLAWRRTTFWIATAETAATIRRPASMGSARLLLEEAHGIERIGRGRDAGEKRQGNQERSNGLHR